jgi:hypothetical protein
MKPVKLPDKTLDAMLGIGPDYVPPHPERCYFEGCTFNAGVDGLCADHLPTDGSTIVQAARHSRGTR